jgi:hypothetical protein
MTRLLDPTTDTFWRFNFGKRYLRLHDFIKLCDAVGLRSCTEAEVEEYERQGWLFPAARLITPEAYARAYREAELRGLTKFEMDENLIPFHDLNRAIHFQIDWPDPRRDEDLRHPIDKAWGRVVQLVRPRDEDFRPWDSYRLEVQIDDMMEPRNLAEHFYHYWQVYELYQVRRSEKGMYRDYVVPAPWPMNQIRGDYLGLARGLEAMSQFQHLHDCQRQRYLAPLTPDEDREIVLTDDQQDELRTLLRAHAQAVCEDLAIKEEELYHFLRGLMRFHHSYERAERVKLAKILEYDIWRTVELIEALTGSPSEEIADMARRTGTIIRDPYLQELFPNRRKQVREKSLRILRGLAREEYNMRASNYGVEERELEALLDFAESTDLALFGYTLVEVNEAFFSRHSWRIAASYLALKSLASLPESLIRTVTEKSVDRQIISEPDPSATKDLYNALCFLLSSREREIWRAYENVALRPYRSAENKAEFSNSLAHLTTLIKNSQNAKQYLSRSATLATLLRNFTSHHLLEDRELLQGQYVRSVRAMVATILLIWKTALKHSLL